MGGLPPFLDMVFDASRNRVYATDYAGGNVYALDGTTGQKVDEWSFGQTLAFPEGLDISADDTTLAVAMYGLGHVQLIDLTTGTPGATLSAGGSPTSVKFGRAGRLYEAGLGSYLNVFDTSTDTLVGHSTNPVTTGSELAELAVTADGNTAFVLHDNSTAGGLLKFDISTDSPGAPTAQSVSWTPGPALAVTPDGTQVFTDDGRVWDPGLQHLVGTYRQLSLVLNEIEPNITYSHGDMYISVPNTPVVEVVSANGFPYHELGTVGLSGTVYANTVNTAGTLLYVSDNVSDFEIIDLTQPLQPPPARGWDGWLDLVRDGAHNVLYASNQQGGYVDVISMTNGAVIDSIDMGDVSEPTGMSLSPDGSTLAVALNGAWQIALIDTGTRTVSGHMYPANGLTVRPWDVKYGRAGRLYESSDYYSADEANGLRIFDTSTGQQIAQFSSVAVDHEPWLAISPDGNDLYSVENAPGPAMLRGFDISTDSPGGPVHSASAGGTGRVVVRNDGAQVDFSGGVVYSRLLAGVLSTTGGGVGGFPAYAAAANEVVVARNDGWVWEFPLASPWLTGGSSRPVTGANLVQVDPTGTTIYVTVGFGVDIIKWGTADPPRAVTATRGDQQASLIWNAPIYTGTTPISSYTITSSPGGLTQTVPFTQLFDDFTGLTNGTTYTFTVVATNASGDSNPSAPSNPVTPRVPTVPTPPQNVSATGGHLQALVSWTPPLDNGDRTISGYTVTSSPGGVQASAGPTATGVVVTGLTGNTTYTFTVVASNAIGDSQPSAASNAVLVKPDTAPDAPNDVSAVAGNAQATVSWSVPADDGGVPITGYTVTSNDGLHSVGAAASATSVIVAGLTNGTTYTFMVTATNSVGTSVPSASSNAVTPFAPTVPGPPLNVTAVAHNMQADVGWSPPISDGRSPITGYTVTSSPGGVTASVGASTFFAVVSGLTNGTAYTFTVTATNAIGTGAPSDPSNVVYAGSPTAPEISNAVAGVGSATVTWIGPFDDGGAPVTEYTVSSSGGAQTTVNGSTFSATLAGLSPDPHTFTVTATNVYGTGPASPPSNDVTPADGGTYNALTPGRVLDTRNGTGGVAVRKVGSRQTIKLHIAGSSGVPSNHVSAVVLNVTVTGTTGSGYLTAYPSGVARPLASNINFGPGQTVANLVEVAVGTDGNVAFYVSGASTDIVADVQGWVGDSLNSYTRSGLFNGLSPMRILDTRAGVGSPLAKLLPGQTLQLTVDGNGGVPLSGVSAVVMNVTVTGPTKPGYLTLYPWGKPRPVASNLNFVAGQTVANRVIVPVSADGIVSIYNGSSGTVDVIADVNGYYTDATSTQGGSAYVPMAPVRIDDTRSCPNCGLPPDYLIDIQFTSWPEPITGIVLNVTATNEQGPGYLTLAPDDGSFGNNSSPPLASDVNFVAHKTVANLVVLTLPPDGAFNTFDAVSYTDVIWDMEGFYGAVVTAPPPGLVLPAMREPSHSTIAPRSVRIGIHR